MKYIIAITMLVIVHSIPAQEKKSNLIIHSPIENSSVFIDGKFAGTDSAKLFLERGNYLLMIKENGRGWNSVLFRDSIFMRGGSEQIVINYGAVDLAEVASSAGVFSLMNAGSEKSKSVSSIRNLADLSATYDYNKPVKLNFETAKEKRFIESTTFKLLIGSAISLGAAAAYFKIKADDNYDKYQSNLDRSFLDETEKYDLYSGIAFGALQVNFGALLYHFLKER